MKKVNDQVKRQVEDQVYRQVEDQVWWQVQNQVEVRIVNRIVNQVDKQVMNQVWNQVWRQVDIEPTYAYTKKTSTPSGNFLIPYISKLFQKMRGCWGKMLSG